MKYLADGTECEVICELPDGRGFVVEPYWVDSETNEPMCGGEPYVVGKVYDSPPSERKAKEYSQLAELIQQAKDDLREIEREKKQALQERDRLLDKLKQVPALQRLDDFIEGKFTHLVCSQYGHVSVIPKSDLACKDDSYYSRKPDRMKLISLFGNDDGSLSWEVSRYKDGSGCSEYKNVFYVFSEDEAKAKAAEIIADELESRYSQGCNMDTLLRSAEAIGIDVDAKYRDAHRAVFAKKLQADIDNASKSLAELQLKLQVCSQSPLEAS